MKCGTDEPTQVINLPDFWTMVSRARTRFLGLDYDGTLAPFHVEPMQAQPLARIREILNALQETAGTTLAVISGRPVAEVRELLGGLRTTMIGSHGFELLRPDGTLFTRHPRAEQREGLHQAHVLAEELGLGAHLETKLASVAFHTRGMAPERVLQLEEQIFAIWSAVTGVYGLECRPFNGGVEIRAAGWNKGDALRRLLADQPAGTFAVYVGDDDTDEDAFREIRRLGIGIKVGSLFKPTAARGFLAECRAVRGFLATWLSMTTDSER